MFFDEILDENQPRVLKSDRGFSLIEVMITVGVLSIIALSSATMMSDMARESARFRRVTERNNFEQKLVALYQKSDLCTCNLGGGAPLQVANAPVATAINGLKSGCGTATNDVYQSGIAGGFPVDTNLKVTSITISDPQFINATDYTATATIKYDDHPTFGSLKPGRYSFMFTKAAAAVAPYPVQTCSLGGAISGGGGAAGWTLTGNAATGPADYLGTSDNQDLFFRRNGGLAGMLKIDQTSFGVNALANFTGASTNNTAFGVSALNGVTSGSGNVGVGVNSGGLASDAVTIGTGSNNTYLGTSAGPSGASNPVNQTAIGYNAKASGDNVMVLGGTGAAAVKVGIGTTSPVNVLDVVSSAATGTQLLTSNSNAAGWSAINLNTDSGNIGGIWSPGSATGFAAPGQVNRVNLDATGTADGVNITAMKNTGDIRFNTGGFSERMRIAADGQVDIGGPAPYQNKLLTVTAPSSAAATSATAKGIYVRTQDGPTGGQGGNVSFIMGGGDSNSGQSGIFTIGNSTAAKTASTLFAVDLVSINYGSSMVGAHFRVMDSVTSGMGTTIGSESIAIESVSVGFGTAIGAVGTATLQGGPATGGTGTLIGVRGLANNAWNGSTSRAMGGYFTADQGSGQFAQSYGVYIGPVTGTGTYSLYASDGSAPSYFAGNVGVGAASPTEKLHVVGNLRVQGSTDCTLGNGAGGTNCSSDIRLKNNVVEIQNATEKIQSLRGVEFDWNEKAQSPGRHDIGVIAQEVEKAFPTAVVTDSKTGYKKVDYAVLVAPLIQAVNEIVDKIISILLRLEDQDREIQTLKAEIETMKTQQQNLNARLEALEQRKQ